MATIVQGPVDDTAETACSMVEMSAAWAGGQEKAAEM